MAQLTARLAEGKSIAEAFAQQRPLVSEMEIGIVAAVERTGRLEHGFTQLSHYYRALDEARANIIKRSAYPIFILHFGILTVGLKALITGAGVAGYIHTTIVTFVALYLIVGVVGGVFYLLWKQGAGNPSVDKFLRKIPLFGKVRRAFAISRFCATYEMQLDAGVNVLDAMETAERASQSGLIRRAIHEGLPKLRTGSQPSELLTLSAFPEPMVQAITVAEESGSMETELKRLAVEYQNEGLSRLEILSEWLPRLLYIGILIYIGYGIIQFYSVYLHKVESIGE